MARSTPVSYTHLDVYKRQDLGGAGPCVRTGMSCVGAARCEMSNCNEPVSYTHLDVYKRQMQQHAVNLLFGQVVVTVGMPAQRFIGVGNVIMLPRVRGNV